MIAQHPEPINIPSDRDSYRAWLRDLDEPTRMLLFGVERHADTFRCPTNGRLYTDEHPVLQDGCLWTRCYWCDIYGTVRGSPGFDRASPQPHAYTIVEERHV